MAAAKSKTVDKSKLLSKLVKKLKKEFGALPKREQLPVLESMIYALCLENSTYEAADKAFGQLKSDFFDWNEIRVSTVNDLEPVFEGVNQPEWCAMRVRYLLYYVFDHQFSYDFDGLKKKPTELAQKQLSKIKHLTPFARHYVLQKCLDSHVIPMDERMTRTAIWLGVIPVGADEEQAAELLKGHVRKADGPEFFWLLKSLSVSKYSQTILEMSPGGDHPELEFSLEDAEERLDDVLSGRARKRLSAQKRTADKKAEADKTKKAPARTSGESAANRKAAEKTSKKAAAKKETSGTKTATEKTSPTEKTASGKKAARKTAGSKKTAKKKTTAKKTASKKTSARKSSSTKKSTAKKSAAKKSTAKKSTTKKKTARK